MWIFTKRGFVAIAEFDPDRKDSAEFMHKAEYITGNRCWLVRSRQEEHLEDFLWGGGESTRARKIVNMEGADYQYRALVNELELSRCLVAAGRDIDYHSLKVAAKELDKEYYEALHNVWVQYLMDADQRPPFDPDDMDGVQEYLNYWNRYDNWEARNDG